RPPAASLFAALQAALPRPRGSNRLLRPAWLIDRRDPGDLRVELGERGLRAGKTLTLLSYDVRRRTSYKALVGELGLGLLPLPIDQGSFVEQAFAFGGRIDFNLQLNMGVVRRKYSGRRSVESRRACSRSDVHLRQTRQCRKILVQCTHALGRGSRRRNREADALARLHSGFDAHLTSVRHDFL